MSDRQWHFDNLGLLVQKDGDGGDTAQRTGMYYLGRFLTTQGGERFLLYPEFDEKLSYLEYGESGNFRRHPQQWNALDDFSRDQQTPLVIAMGIFGFTKRLGRMFWNHVKRFGKYQNKDFASPEHWGYYVRAFKSRWLYPYLLLSDIWMLGGTLVRLYKASKDFDDVGDDLNCILALLQSELVMPTPASKLTTYLYKKYRAFGGPQYALDRYFREETGANPINELYKPIIDRYFR